MSTSFPARLRVLAAHERPDEVQTPAAASMPVSQECDEELMFKVQAGDEQALGHLFDRYSRLVFEIGRQILRDCGEAEELVQEVFLNVHRKCRSFDSSKGSFRGWLRRVAYREAFDRRSYLVNRRFYDCDSSAEVVEQVRSIFDMEKEADARRLAELLRQAVEDLPERQRATLQLVLFQGHTLREISQLHQESLVNTRHHYYRALDRLRKALCSRGLRVKGRES